MLRVTVTPGPFGWVLASMHQAKKCPWFKVRCSWELLQMDFHGDISGFLSAHPQTPLLSLHRLHATNPIFPSMDHKNSTRNLIRAAKLDESRLLQQSICYYHIKNWSISVSWGYTVQIYQEFIPPSILHRPIATFAEWMRGAQPPFMFNSRNLPKNPCEAPNVLYFDSVGENRGNHFVTTIYTKKGSLPDCSSSRINGSFEHISKAHVLSPRRRLQTGVSIIYTDLWNLSFFGSSILGFIWLKSWKFFSRVEVEENAVRLWS